MRRLSVCLLTASVLMMVSCGGNENGVFLTKSKVIRNALDVDTLNGTRIIWGDTLILSVDDIMYFNGWIIVQSLETSTSVFNVFDMDGNLTSRFGNIGRAENEFTEGTTMYGQFDSKQIYVNDVNAAALKFIDVPTSIESGRCVVSGKIPTTERVINAAVLDESVIVYAQMTANNFRLSIKNVNDTLATEQFDLYVPSDDPFGTYRSFMKVNAPRKMAALAMGRMNQVNFISLDNGKRSSCSLYEDPVLPDEKRMVYYCNITASDNYVYALYMNQTYEESYEVDKPMEIHVFDWNGNYIRTYVTKQYISRISIAPDDNLIAACDIYDNVYIYPLKKANK